MRRQLRGGSESLASTDSSAANEGGKTQRWSLTAEEHQILLFKVSLSSSFIFVSWKDRLVNSVYIIRKMIMFLYVFDDSMSSLSQADSLAISSSVRGRRSSSSGHCVPLPFPLLLLL